MISKIPAEDTSVLGTGTVEDQQYNRNQKHGQSNRITVDGISEIHQHPGESGHLRTELDKNLIEYGHDLYKEHNDHSHHHSRHDQRICNRVFEAFSDGIFPVIVIAQGFHHFVQRPGLLTDLHHMQHIGGEQPGL